MEIDNYNILCPYCKSECGDQESFEGCDIWDEESIEFECEDCGKKFEARRVVTVDYRTEKNCSLNNEKHIKGKHHCEKCDIYNPIMKEGSF